MLHWTPAASVDAYTTAIPLPLLATKKVRLTLRTLAHCGVVGAYTFTVTVGVLSTLIVTAADVVFVPEQVADPTVAVMFTVTLAGKPLAGHVQVAVAFVLTGTVANPDMVGNTHTHTQK